MLMQAGLQSDRQPAAMAGGDIDLGVLRDALWRRKSLILGLTLLAAGIAFIAVNLVTPRYKSEARVLIEMRESIFLRPDAEKTFERGTTVDQEAVTSQVQLILSRDLAREVINKLKLGDNPEFDPLLRVPSVWRTVLGFVGIIRDPLGLTHEERVYRSYYERLSAFQVEKSRVIAIDRRARSWPRRSPTPWPRPTCGSSRRPSRSRPAPPAAGSRARSNGCAQTWRRQRPRSNNTARRPIFSSATTIPPFPTSSSAISTASSPPRVRRRRTPRPRRSSFATRSRPAHRSSSPRSPIPI